ncbi:MAG TPA: chitobiase/beta-hexosaminidase C-terminal domain-containing protein, partial [Opitutaceae bacterium]|nr:chitobiase/beta-hexosaminidase C-terminal domain-containing protein [Opitutaceae bacterium]
SGSEALKLRWMVGGNLVAGNKVTEGGTETRSQFSPAANASLGDTLVYTFQEINHVVTVTVTINGGSLHTYTYTLDSSWDTIPLYFKAGNYNQDNTDGTTDGALVAFYALSTLPQTGTPTFSPATGTYANVQSVSISDTTASAAIRYTTDASTPTETTGTLYSGPVSIGSTTTLKAIAYKTGLIDSAVSTAVYTIQTPASSGGAITPAPSGGGGAFDGWFLGALGALGVLRWRRARR